MDALSLTILRTTEIIAFAVGSTRCAPNQHHGQIRFS